MAILGRISGLFARCFDANIGNGHTARMLVFFMRASRVQRKKMRFGHQVPRSAPKSGSTAPLSAGQDRPSEKLLDSGRGDGKDWPVIFRTEHVNSQGCPVFTAIVKTLIEPNTGNLARIETMGIRAGPPVAAN